MRTCKTCRKYKGCLESSREYPCRDWERRDKRGRNHSTSAGARPDPARLHPEADHRPRTAQAHPAQESAEGQDNPGLGDRIGVTVRDSPDSVGDHLHIAGRTNLRRRWRRCQSRNLKNGMTG